MKHLFAILIFCLLTTVFPTKSHALTENEYNELLQVPYFKQADQELSFSFFGSLMYYSYICSAKITHE